MAKRKKTRTHQIGSSGQQSESSKTPKSFVIRSRSNHHQIGDQNSGGTRTPHRFASLNALVKDFRKVMEPNTASKVKERKSNRFKDFLAMAGPLGVTHIIVFSQSSTTTKDNENLDREELMISNINFKIFRLPRGPTLTFKVLRFSLMSDVSNCERSPRSPGGEFKTEPLLIMNNFNPGANSTPEEVNQLNLLTTTFRNLFPQIKIHSVQLVQTRRVVFLSYNPQTRTIDFRHYLITVKPIGVSRNIQKLIHGVTVTVNESESEGKPVGPTRGKRKKKILDLSCIEDVSEYVLGRVKFQGPGSVASSGAFTGAQSEEIIDESDHCSGLSSGGEEESEGDDDKNNQQRRIELPQNYLGGGNTKNSKKAIKLREIGPRMELGLIKIEQGLSNSEVLYHELIKKSKMEDQKIKCLIKEKEKLRLERRKIQEENVRRKKLEKESSKRGRKGKDKMNEAVERDGTRIDDGDGDEEDEGDEAEKHGEEEKQGEQDEEDDDDDDSENYSALEDFEDFEGDFNNEDEEIENEKKKVKFS
ncbi:brix domain-containing protein [Phakopsora pachyrhizi]|uniref:Brix domain-containing protein n=1 Tax=Phakopsora pachyrhizi TaxID=170000 RepID=A0AAV0BQP6_PHAPC|nr:brix domain-containing protein [Phakopsora pachyrhizi]